MCLALALACNKEIIPNAPIEVTEGEEVTLSMSVSVPGMEVATRALGEYSYADGAHPSLWVVVFDQQGYLVETAKAYDQEYTDISADHKTTTQFSVDLHATPEPCTIHYLLNYSDGDNLELPYGHETSVIGALAVENKDVYWQRKSLPGGINDNVDYVAANFTQIPLVRNFAKITVTNSANNFTLSGFYVLNVPKSGTVAPLSNGAFVNYQHTVPTGQTLYGVLTSGGYFGNMPDGVQFNNTAAPAATDFKKDPVYLYENTYSSQKDAKVPTVLIKGKFGEDANDTYYKADLLTNNLETGLQDYAHILRNFHYVLNIKSVVASGKSDPQGAIAAAANNNLSGAVEIKDLTNVTNGQAGIYVSFTDTTLVSSNPIVLKYKFVPDITKPAEVSNERVTVVAPAGNVLASEAETGSDINSGSWNGWRTLTIRPKELPKSTQEQTIVLYDQATLLRREVVIRLRKKLDMDVTCNPKVVDAAVGQSMTLNIKLDTTLNKALFPLDFTIESQTNESSNTLKQYISPASSEVISVQTGKSIVPGYSNSKSYQYIKTLSYDDYTVLKNTAKQNNVDYVILPVAFKTNIANNASTVYVRNQYFNDASDYFVNKSEVLVDGGFYGAGNEVKLMFLADAAGDYTITSSVLAETKAVNNTIALAAGEVYEKTLYTSTWSDRVAVTITGPSSYNKTLQGVATRSKLAMKATSIKVGTSDLTTFQEFGIYTTDNAAKSMTGSIGTATTSDLKSAAGALLVRENLTQNTDLYFSYTDGSYVYVASAKANALHAGAALTFAQHELPLEMSATLEGEQYYGAGKTVTLNLTTNKAGTYTVTFKEGTTNTTASIKVPSGQTTGTATYTTKAFSGAISATVVYTDNTQISVNSDTRNVLYIKPASVTGDTGYYTSDVKMSTNKIASNNWNSVSTVATFSLDELRAGVEVQIDNLNSSTTYYFAYQYYSGMSAAYRYKSMTAADLANGTAMSFGSNY